MVFVYQKIEMDQKSLKMDQKGLKIDEKSLQLTFYTVYLVPGFALRYVSQWDAKWLDIISGKLTYHV